MTFEEYDHFCEVTNRSKPKDCGWGRGRRPVVYVSHEDAEAYCAWLSDVTKARYRLPTEAEWEYACRARDRDAYAFGNTISDQQANFGRNVGKTTEVGAYPANGWNLHDMHGNVWEWCADAPRTYKPEPVTDPKGTGTQRVLRGGSWINDARYLRSARRDRGRAGRAGQRYWLSLCPSSGAGRPGIGRAVRAQSGAGARTARPGAEVPPETHRRPKARPQPPTCTSRLEFPSTYHQAT